MESYKMGSYQRSFKGSGFWALALRVQALKSSGFRLSRV